MSNRKNNTKSKKTTGNSHNDFNSFRIEALEPRLLQQVANLSARQCQKSKLSVAALVLHGCDERRFAHGT
jgi:hypothetical protein